MNWRLDVRAGAESDISEAVKWYEEERPGLGLELIDEIRAAINRVVESPRAYRLLRRKPEVRRVLTRRFPYKLFYRVDEDRITLLRVLHVRRDSQSIR